MPDTPYYYLIEAIGNEDGILLAVSAWRTMELDAESDVPLMGGGLAFAVEASDKPEDYALFPSITFIAHGELALCRMLHKVTDLAELSADDSQQWVNDTMITLNKLAEEVAA